MKKLNNTQLENISAGFLCSSDFNGVCNVCLLVQGLTDGMNPHFQICPL
jgi:hypothetical protein